MIDSVSSYFNNPKYAKAANQGPKQSIIGTRDRLPSAPTHFFEKKYKSSGPKTKLYTQINLNRDYLALEETANIKTGENLHELVTSFFPFDIRKKTPHFTKEEWEEIINEEQKEEELEFDMRKKLYSSLSQGFPSDMRKEIWKYLGEVEKLKQEYSKKDICYEKLGEELCPQEEKIKNDVKRSFNNHDFFKENKEEKTMILHKILRAYAHLDPEVGYTQGMNFLVGILLYMLESENEDYKTGNINRGELGLLGKGKQGQIELIEEGEIGEEEEGNNSLENKKTIVTVEEEAFWLLVYIMQKKDWRKLYVNETPKLQELLEVFEQEVKEKLPDLHVLLEEHSCFIGCFSQHFLTILLYNSPFELAKRIFETFLVVGEDILVHVLIKILTIREKEILALEETEGLFNFLRTELIAPLQNNKKEEEEEKVDDV